MIIYDTDCVDCETSCLYDACPYYMIKIFTCDECGEDFTPNKLYVYDDQMLCKDCLAKKFDTVEKRIDEFE